MFPDELMITRQFDMLPNFVTNSWNFNNSSTFTNKASKLQMKNTNTTIINIVARLCSLSSCAENFITQVIQVMEVYNYAFKIS